MPTLLHILGRAVQGPRVLPLGVVIYLALLHILQSLQQLVLDGAVQLRGLERLSLLALLALLYFVIRGHQFRSAHKSHYNQYTLNM